MKSSFRVIANTFSQLASRGLVILASLVTTALLTRLLGSSGYGDYIFITSFILIFVSLSDLGLTIIGVREASLNKGETGKVFGNILILRLLLTLMLFFLFNLAAFILPQFAGLRIPTFAASFVIFFLTLRTISQGILQANLRLDLASILEVFASLVFLVFLGIFLFLNKAVSLNLLMGFWSISALFSSLLGLLIAFRYQPIHLSFHHEEAWRLFKEALPFGMYLLVFSVYDRGVDSFILKTYYPSSVVGYYGLAYKIHGNLVLGAAFLMNSLFPLLASLKNNTEKLRKTYEKAFTVLLLGGGLIFGGGLVFAPWVINIIAGGGFSPSVLATRLLLGATFFSYLNHLTGFLLVALGKQKELLGFSLIAFVVNLLLNLFFIPRFSFPAAAIITILTEATIFLFTQNFLTREFGLKYTLLSLKENWQELWFKKQHYFESL